METREFLLAARLDAGALEAWIKEGWLAPRRNGGGGRFSDVDLARAQLIRDLGELGVNDEGIPVILDLVDQLHGLRRILRELLSTIHAQPEATQRRLLSDIRAQSKKRRQT
jgi:chaperone modulatory protein CbpM